MSLWKGWSRCLAAIDEACPCEQVSDEASRAGSLALGTGSANNATMGTGSDSHATTIMLYTFFGSGSQTVFALILFMRYI